MTVKKISMFLGAVALALAPACAGAAGLSVGLSVHRVKAAPDESGPVPAHAGRLTCGAQKNESVFVVLEAYFVGRGAEKGAKDVLTGGLVVGRFEFGRDRPKAQEFSIASDAVLVAPDGAGDAAGEPPAFRGIILRVVQGGKVLKAFSSHSEWARAAAAKTVSIGGRTVNLELPPPERVPFDESKVSASEIARGVSSAGGCVSAPFRFSIMWNEDGKSRVDLDAHAVEPSGSEIYYASHKAEPTEIGGQLDVDMVRPEGTGVENIFWGALDKLADGKYRFFVRNFDGGRNKGVKTELVFDGDTFSYETRSNVRGDFKVATLEVYRGRLVHVLHHAALKP